MWAENCDVIGQGDLYSRVVTCNEDVGNLGRGGVLRQPAGRRGGHRPGADLCPMARVVRATAVSVVAPGVRGDHCGGNRRVLGDTVNRNLAANGQMRGIVSRADGRPAIRHRWQDGT
jgi:hypothetical protein